MYIIEETRKVVGHGSSSAITMHLMPTMLTWHPTSAKREDDDKELNGIETLQIKLNLELYASKLTTHLWY